MSKLSNTLGIPSMGGGAGSNVMGPLKGMAPGWDGVPTGVPSGLHKAIGDVSSPLGGLQAKGDGTPEWRNAPIDVGQNQLVNPTTAPTPPKGYNVWADPDMSHRGWGWGMGADGALHTGVMGGGPAGTPWGPQGSAAGQQLATQLRSGQGMPMGQQRPAMGAGGPQGMPPGAMPQGGPAMGPGAPQGQNPQAMQQLVAQLRMQQQQPGQALPGTPAAQ